MLIYAGDNLIIDGVNPTDNTYDTFNTPDNFVRASLQIIHNLWGELSLDYPHQVLDPGAGNGVWGNAFKDYWEESSIFGVEIQDMPRPAEYDEWFSPADYLKWDSPIDKFDVIIGNPPFGIYEGKTDRRLAEKFIRHSMNRLKTGGVLYFLLKSHYTHGIQRSFGINTKARGSEPGLFQDYPLYWKFETVSRIPFRKDKGNRTNNVKYAMFMWIKGFEPRQRYGMSYVPTSRFNWKNGELKWAY